MNNIESNFSPPKKREREREKECIHNISLKS